MTRVFFVATDDGDVVGWTHTVGHTYVNVLVDVREHASRRPRNSHRSGGITCVRQYHLDLLQVDKLQSSAKLTVGVRESYRRHGVGSKLIERGTGWAEANGYRKLYNSVPSTR
jgi:GNAT superfamily N-acetyltransferase